MWKEKGILEKARAFYTRSLTEAEAVGAERFKSAAREALAGMDSPERKP